MRGANLTGMLADFLDIAGSSASHKPEILHGLLRELLVIIVNLENGSMNRIV
jgi:hypothetical protein